jgi:hypothetical protein
MNAEQINAFGGWCELVGVGFLVRDLTALARYRGKRKEGPPGSRSGRLASGPGV